MVHRTAAATTTPKPALGPTQSPTQRKPKAHLSIHYLLTHSLRGAEYSLKS
jgi:hypothetical protein